jgi:hypothetical protein
VYLQEVTSMSLQWQLLLQNPQGFTTRLKLALLDFVVVWECNKGLGQNETPLPHSICFN